ncbi:L-2-hydroxyglutarate oxidase [Arthrobacter ramosus]|uniref:L-2-hydroxyglutarate oxidase n=1 Tax=Arthrobacter ramosus TaxID=1672 RepID=A0ABV5Y756_ARTRM|nr:L-2-hydroxyglutarate oxidase [Arthrobacter ramosus]
MMTEPAARGKAVKQKTVAVIGGGIVGLAVAERVCRTYPGVKVIVFEKESSVAQHQTGHNSGVVHAGLYYKPGSLKAQLTLKGRELLQAFCDEEGLQYLELGKLIVATEQHELPELDEIERRALANGVPDLQRVSRERIAEIEPHITAIDGVYSPHTASVDYVAISQALARRVTAAGGEVRLSAEVEGISETSMGVQIRTNSESFNFDSVIVCAGLHGDHLMRLAGRTDEMRMIPFRGEYFKLSTAAATKINGMVYPVPDPAYPFLGVHLTRGVDDEVHVGPNAVLAFAIEGYRKSDISIPSLARTLTWPGFWYLAKDNWRMGAVEMATSFWKRAYLKQVRRYLPDLSAGDLTRDAAGVRAQGLGRKGELIDDFVFEQAGRILFVRNAPSPAATSSLAIAEHILESANLEQYV